MNLMKLKSHLPQSPIIKSVLKRRFIKFGTVGFSGTLINVTALYVNQEYFFRWIESIEKRLPVSLAAAIFLATLNNFAWNRGWTWRDRKRKTGHGFFLQMGQYFLASGLAIGTQYLCTMALVKLMHYMLANVLSIGAAAFLNFLINDVWTFATGNKASSQEKLNGTSVLCSEKTTTVEDCIEGRHRHPHIQ